MKPRTVDRTAWVPGSVLTRSDMLSTKGSTADVLEWVQYSARTVNMFLRSLRDK